MMSEKEKVFYGNIVKVGRVYLLGSSLVVVYHGPLLAGEFLGGCLSWALVLCWRQGG